MAPHNEKPLPNPSRENGASLCEEERAIFARWLTILNGGGIPYVVAGAFAVHAYTGIWRDTKDLDIFLEPKSLKRALDLLSDAGYSTEVRSPRWLAKVHRPPYVMDLIFGFFNGKMPINGGWLTKEIEGNVAGVKVRLIPLEELIASKLYVAARDRFDGADIAHLIRMAQGMLNWDRVLDLLKEYKELLLWHLLMFNFVYPGHADYLPQGLIERLFDEVRKGWKEPRDPKAFRGMLLDSFTFAVDVLDWGYDDSRSLEPLVDPQGGLL